MLEDQGDNIADLDLPSALSLWLISRKTLATLPWGFAVPS